MLASAAAMSARATEEERTRTFAAIEREIEESESKEVAAVRAAEEQAAWNAEAMALEEAKAAEAAALAAEDAAVAAQTPAEKEEEEQEEEEEEEQQQQEEGEQQQEEGEQQQQEEEQEHEPAREGRSNEISIGCTGWEVVSPTRSLAQLFSHADRRCCACR